MLTAQASCLTGCDLFLYYTSLISPTSLTSHTSHTSLTSLTSLTSHTSLTSLTSPTSLTSLTSTTSHTVLYRAETAHLEGGVPEDCFTFDLLPS